MDLCEWDFLVSAAQWAELDVGLGTDWLTRLVGGFGGLRVGAAARLRTDDNRQTQQNLVSDLRECWGNLGRTYSKSERNQMESWENIGRLVHEAWGGNCWVRKMRGPLV